MCEPELDASSGLQVLLGTYAEAVAMVGAKSEISYAEIDVDSAMIQYFCGVAEDGNPSYWSEKFATPQWGGLISPPSMLHSWAIPFPWRPGGAQSSNSFSMQVPLPGDKVINVSSDAEFIKPIYVGDRLSYREELKSVTEEKRTRLGVGHFVETILVVCNQRGEPVARVTNSVLRYCNDSPRR